MENVTTLGVDLAKNDFQVCGMNSKGKVLFNKKLNRKKILEFVINLKISDDFHVAMEACGGSNHWGRLLQSHEFEVKLIAPQFVKPYVKSHKNDHNDAEAIAEASRRPTMRFVGVKSETQQEINGIHNIRGNLVKRKTSISNEVRALLFEFGITIPQGISQTRKQVPIILENAENNLSIGVRELISELYTDLIEVMAKVEKWDAKLELICKENETCSRIVKIEGIGTITATAIFAAVGNPKAFKNGREFAAWLGLTPRQHSTGGKNVLLGISKRGDSYLRKNLVHGCRSVVTWCKEKTDKKSTWIQDKIARRGINKATVALANKTARVVWAVMAKGEDYRPSVNLAVNLSGAA